jgi:hypothetical protein
VLAGAGCATLREVLALFRAITRSAARGADTTDAWASATAATGRARMRSIAIAATTATDARAITMTSPLNATRMDRADDAPNGTLA